MLSLILMQLVCGWMDPAVDAREIAKLGYTEIATVESGAS